MHYKMEFVSDVVKQQIEDCTRFDIKHDGSCGALVLENGKYVPYARFDIKKDKKTGRFEMPKCYTSKWIPCEEEPIEEEATHWPHFRPCADDEKAYKWYIKAFTNASESISKMDKNGIITVEYMGKKFNGKASDPINNNDSDDIGIVIHGTLGLNIPKELRNVNGFNAIFEALPVIEGIVAYPSDSNPMKIRAELFEGLSWGNLSSEFTKKYGHSGRGLSNEALI